MIVKLNEIYWNPISKKLYDSLDDAVSCKNEYGSTTPLVSSILNLLIQEYPLVCKNENIKNILWGTQWISNESIPQLIKRTRVAIKDIDRDVIENIKGNGYKINKVEKISLQVDIQEDDIDVLVEEEPKKLIEPLRITRNINERKSIIILGFSILMFSLSSISLIYCIEKHVFFDLVPLSEITKMKDFSFTPLSEDKFILKSKKQECELDITNKIARCTI